MARQKKKASPRGVLLSEIRRVARLTWPKATVKEFYYDDVEALITQCRWFVSAVEDGWILVEAAHDDRCIARRMALAAVTEASIDLVRANRKRMQRRAR